jgi:hypothetical protein
MVAYPSATKTAPVGPGHVVQHGPSVAAINLKQRFRIPTFVLAGHDTSAPLEHARSALQPAVTTVQAQLQGKQQRERTENFK